MMMKETMQHSEISGQSKHLLSPPGAYLTILIKNMFVIILLM